MSTADRSPLESEAKAVLESGWWSGFHNISQRCKWPGISCNAAGSIIKIDLSGHVFEVEVGDRFGELNFSSFPNLLHLDLSGCQLGGNIPPQIGDISALEYLDLSGSHLSGELPPSLGNLTRLEILYISSNRIHGSIPPQLGKLEKLVNLSLGGNGLTGQIPHFLETLINLRSLDISRNQFDEGPIPQNIWNLTGLVFLGLGRCGIVGPIPSALGQLTNLELLDLGSNKFEGSIPRDIENLKKLRYLNIRNNGLTGHIPLFLCHLTKLESIILSLNQFSGSIPSCIGNLSSLTGLSLDSNLLQGSIPKEIGNLEALRSLDLSQNRLNGSIPSQINKLSRLSDLVLSFNQLSGSVPILSATKLVIHDTGNGCCKIFPDPFEGNKGLSPCMNSSVANNVKNSKRPYYLKIYLPIAIFTTFFFILCCLLLSRFKVKNNRAGEQPAKNGDICSIWNYDGKIAYEDIIAATDDFDFRHCIGIGGYGSVYKAQLPCGKVVALKKLHRLEAENPAFDKSFRNEIKFLTEIRHRNIVKLHGFCLHRRSMFLIYEYMGKGVYSTT
ncbi:hypothetical protein GQ457_13G025220 [Hibiscus cannabinus]